MPIFLLFGLVAGAFAVHAHHEVLRRDWHAEREEDERRHKELLEAIEASKTK